MSREAHLLRIANCEEPRRSANVMFVHGLNGDARGSWEPTPERSRFQWLRRLTRRTVTNSAPNGSWLDWLPETIPGIAIWSLSYPASSNAWRGTAMSLPIAPGTYSS